MNYSNFQQKPPTNEKLTGVYMFGGAKKGNIIQTNVVHGVFAGVRTEPRGASCSQYPTQTLNIHDLLYFIANSMHISLIHKRTFIDFEPELFDRRLTENRQKQYEDTSKCFAELFAFNRSFY